jgi:hypothetical protein
MILPTQGAPVFLDVGLGFRHEDVVLSAKRAFAGRLYKLSLYLDQQISAGIAELGDASSPGYEAKVLSLLTLTTGMMGSTLLDLGEIGSGLRAELNPKIFDKLKSFHFMQLQPADEPSLNFINREQTPVLWDMMYEGTIPGEKMDWQRFWGLRIPVTHWEPTSNTHYKIRLNQGLFSVIDQKLEFANSEVSLLAQQLKGGLHHSSLCDEFKTRAMQALRNKTNDATMADAWFATQNAESWFSSFIEKLNEGILDKDDIEVETRNWKAAAIREIFSDPHFTYQLIHFACHCEPHEVSELLTRLTVHIAGEDVSLTVASMADARGERPDEPGPLVFLNACGTGQQGVNAEPPGFPESWITKRGALAVVATLCPVPDLFAHAFARKFYNILFNSVADPQAPLRQRYLAEALLETRRYFMEECRNPLGLAYVLYAVKDACIEAT